MHILARVQDMTCMQVYIDIPLSMMQDPRNRPAICPKCYSSKPEGNTLGCLIACVYVGNTLVVPILLQ